MSINFVELHGPLILPEDANLYEQTPFGEKLGEALTPDVDLSVLRALLFTFSRRFSTEGLTEILLNTHIYTLRNLLVYSLRSLKIKNPTTTSGVYVETLRNTSDLLMPYPYWCEYIGDTIYQYPGLFGRDGERKVIPQSPTLSSDEVPTYLGWLPEYVRKKERQGRNVLLGIDEIFPQDFATESPMRPPDVRGYSQGARNWRLKIASNLAPEK